MAVTISSHVEADYLVIEGEGSVGNLVDNKLASKLCYEEISKHDLQKVLLDFRRVEGGASITDMYGLASSYSSDYPHELRRLKLAVVVDPKHKDLSDFWQLCANNRGYDFRGFTDVGSARSYLSE
jgi:hypothetical protein